MEFDSDTVPNLVKGWRPDNPEEATCSKSIAVVEDNGPKYFQLPYFLVKEFLTPQRLRTSDVGNIRQYHISLDTKRASLYICSWTKRWTKRARYIFSGILRCQALGRSRRARQRDITNSRRNGTSIRSNQIIPCIMGDIRYRSESGSTIHQTTPGIPAAAGASVLYYAVSCGFSQPANCLVIAARMGRQRQVRLSRDTLACGIVQQTPFFFFFFFLKFHYCPPRGTEPHVGLQIRIYVHDAKAICMCMCWGLFKWPESSVLKCGGDRREWE